MQSVPPAASRRTAFGLAFVALSTLMYEVLLTRIFSVERATNASPKAVRRLAAGGTDCITEPV